MIRMKALETSALMDLYVQAAQGYDDAGDRGDSREANRQHSIAERVFKELQRRGLEKELLPLLSHPQPAVRLWAAVHTRDIGPETAEGTLRQIAAGKGITAMNAYAALQSWMEKREQN